MILNKFVKKRIMKTKYFLLFLICLAGICCLSSHAVQAQEKNGVLRGRVFDEAGQTLPGATVYLEEVQSGVVSDVNGFYLISKIPAGQYHLQVSYVGYATQKVTVNVKAGETIEKDFRLKSESKQLEMVEVGGSFQGYQRATNYRKSSLNLRDVVSADQVGRFPDANIGDAMKRIPGINVQYDQGEARFGQIRGTSPDFSSVTINGNRLPSAEGDIRNVQLDLIPADMIQTIVVNKVVTPDMDADAIGGSVNLVTKSSPAKRILNATVGTGFNLISDRMQANVAFTYGDNFFNDKLGLILSASYQNNPIGSDNAEFEWTKDDNGNDYVNDYQVRQYFVQRERQSYSLSLDYKFNLNHRIGFKGIYNHRNDWENRFRQNLKDLDENGMAEEVVFETKSGTWKDARLERQRTMDFALNGEHLFGTTLLNWNLSYAKATEWRPNERYIAYKKEMVQFTPDLSNTRTPYMIPENAADMVLGAAAGYELDELTEQQEDITEDDFKASLNLNIPLRMGNKVNYPSAFFLPIRSMTSNIVVEFAYSNGLHKQALIATGFILLVFILLINLALWMIKQNDAMAGNRFFTRKFREGQDKEKTFNYRRTGSVQDVLWILSIIFALFVVVSLLTVIGFVVFKALVPEEGGAVALSAEFLFGKSTNGNPTLGPAMLNTLVIIAVSLLIALPLGIGAAIYLSEYAKRGSKFVKVIRLFIDTLAGVPSIIFGRTVPCLASGPPFYRTERHRAVYRHTFGPSALIF